MSFFVVSDGERALPIGTAQDHKRIFDDDRGPNTGGMGAFAPSPLMDDGLARTRHERDCRARDSRNGSRRLAIPRFLYVGLMLTPSGPKVIEFNVRLGDPEAQVILPLIDEPLVACSWQRPPPDSSSNASCRLSSDKLVGVVLASRGYPESSESGQPIHGLEAAERLPGVTRVFTPAPQRRGSDS